MAQVRRRAGAGAGAGARAARLTPVRAAAQAQAAPGVQGEWGLAVGAGAARPSPAEVARTALALAASGTVATAAGAHPYPLATRAAYVLGAPGGEGAPGTVAEGQPVLRLRRGALHTANLLERPECSLFVTPPGPAECLTRVTLTGRVVELPAGDAREDARRRFLRAHGPGLGVDAVQPDDLFAVLEVAECFEVGLLGQDREAVLVSAEDYLAAAPDALLALAPQIVDMMNKERIEDVVRFTKLAAGFTLEELEDVQFMWVDSKGFYIRARKRGEDPVDLRFGFPAQLTDEKDAKSMLTMLAQVAWEQELQRK